MDSMKAAVIGCGRMGAAPANRLEGIAPPGWLPMSQAACLHQLPGVELAAMCDTNANVLERAGVLYGVKALYSDYSRLLAELRPDLVSIATRTPGKSEIIECAIRHGVRGIYVEKPLANSLRACRASLGSATRAGVKLAYGVNRRYHATYREARRMIAEGIIGELREITIEHGHGQLLWAHPHSTDLILFFAGTATPIAVQATLESATFVRAGPEHIDSDPRIDHAYFTFDGPLTATISRAGGLNVRLAGTKGNLAVLADGESIRLDLEGGKSAGYFLERSSLRHQPSGGATLTALGELIQAIQTGGAAPIASNDILQGTAMLLGCAYSHLQGNCPVTLADIPEDLVVTGRTGNSFA